MTRDNCNAKSLVPSTRASVVYHLIDVTKTLMREGARLPKSLRVEYIIASGYIKNRFESCHKSNVPDLWFQTIVTCLDFKSTGALDMYISP